MKNKIYLILLGINIVLTIALFFVASKVSVTLLEIWIIYIAISTPIYGYLNYRIVRKELKK